MAGVKSTLPLNREPGNLTLTMGLAEMSMSIFDIF